MIVGSRAFFESIEGFAPKDTDILELVDNPTGFKDVRQFKFSNKCVFQWRRMSLEEFIDVTLQRGFPMEVGKFLVPEFANTIGLTMEHLKILRPLIESLDEAHLYEQIIYESYLSNGSFDLSEEQRTQAYVEYIKYR
jgi:hypothetical protein